MTDLIDFTAELRAKREAAALVILDRVVKRLDTAAADLFVYDGENNRKAEYLNYHLAHLVRSVNDCRIAARIARSNIKDKG
jgi:hypothetical protein